MYTLNAEELVNEDIWKVLVKIEKQNILSDWRDLGIINFGYANDDEKKILFFLQEQNLIELQNLSRVRRILSISDNFYQTEAIKLKLIQPQFSEFYSAFREEYSPTKRSDSPYTTSTRIKQQVKEIIITRQIKGKEKKFLEVLSSGNPKSIKELKYNIPTEACKELKSAVQQKLKGSAITIKTIKSNEINKDSYYLLKLLTD